jgi:hypothetical protein
MTGSLVLDHVADTRGNADVVLQHAKVADFVAHEVDARDRDAHAVGWVDREGRATEVWTRRDHRARDHAFGEDATVAVDVGEEGFERVHALSDRAREKVPLHRADQARHDIERERTLLAAVGEGHTTFGERV